ncbi:DUF5348 domain-containing protein [Paenibacillus filicis]|uniref:DUF5348 domain-containing protein n=1 Tax=Paenibacillus gyeongsangnamensis TaxID=3388067 RepID=A0ABT4QD08_9BACL|nr:DUF5348 domain-containing protein [Paenibacillus filicis]MCZ8514741.1 DUF5348 domain-containing protein [Paenibacillus filicis]
MKRTGLDGRILYDAQTGRWKIWDAYVQPAAVHCGESFEMKVGDDFLPCRIEMDSEWVVYFHNTRFHLHPDVSYWIRVRIDGVYLDLVSWTSPPSSQDNPGCFIYGKKTRAGIP